MAGPAARRTPAGRDAAGGAAGGGRAARRAAVRPRTVALTSATLSLGGSFEPLARQWGLPLPGHWPATAPPDGAPGRRPSSDPGTDPLDWTGLDVGSPFDHPRSGILYVARHLPPPGRDGLPEAYLTELPS